MSDRRRAMIALAGGGALEVLYGHATADSGSLTLPIPSGYAFSCWITDIADKTSSTELVRKIRDPLGVLTDKTNACNRVNTGIDTSGQGITNYDDRVLIRGNNGNTYGTLVAGVDYTYIAWKES